MADPATIASQKTTAMEVPWVTRVIQKTTAWVAMNSNGQVNPPLEDLSDFKVAATTKDGVAGRDVIIQPETGIWVRIYTPDRPATTGPALPDLQLPVFFYFHGGGFALSSANSIFSDFFCRYLCKTFQALVVSVDYRKAPDYRYPTAYDDCYDAVRWLSEAALPEADLSKCFLAGESAGGNIVHHVACRLATDAMMRGRLTVLGNLVFSPFFGGEERTPAELHLLKVDPILDYVICDAAWQHFLPVGANRDHPAANFAGPQAPDLTGLPLAPFLVTVAEYDSLKDWQIRYVDTLKSMGQHVHFVFYKAAVHCFHVLPHLPLSSLFRSDLEQFVHSKLSVPTAREFASSF